MREVMATLDHEERGVASDDPAAGAGRLLVRSAAARALSDLDRDGVLPDLAPGGRYVVELVACAVEWLLTDLACWVGLSPATRTVGDLMRLKDGAKAAARVLALAAYLRLGGERWDAGGARGVPSPEEFAQTVRRALTMISEQGKAGAGG